MTHLRALSISFERAAEIVDNDVGSSRSEEQSILFPQPTTSASDDDGLSVKA